MAVRFANQRQEEIDAGDTLRERLSEHAAGPHEGQAIGDDEIAVGYGLPERSVFLHLDELCDVQDADDERRAVRNCFGAPFARRGQRDGIDLHSQDRRPRRGR
jgi:hypothetical protein